MTDFVSSDNQRAKKRSSITIPAAKNLKSGDDERAKKRNSITIPVAKNLKSESLLESKERLPPQLWLFPSHVESSTEYLEYNQIICLTDDQSFTGNFSETVLLLIRFQDSLCVQWKAIDGMKSCTFDVSDDEAKDLFEQAEAFYASESFRSLENSKVLKFLIQGLVSKFGCSYLPLNNLLLSADADELLLYWFNGRDICHKALALATKDVKEFHSRLPVHRDVTRVTDSALIQDTFNIFDITLDDIFLQTSHNICEMHAVELIDLYHDPRLSMILHQLIENIVLRMIREFAQNPVVTEEYLVNIAPLAMIKNSAILHELLNALVQKIADEALLSETKIAALSLMIHYANKEIIKANDILGTITILTNRLLELKMNDPSLVPRGIACLNELLDAAMTIQIIDLDPEELQNIVTLLEKLASSIPSPSSDANDLLSSIAIEYAQQAFLRITEQKTDWEAGLTASYALVNGVVQLGFAILDKSPGAIIDSIFTIYGAAQGLRGAMKGSKFPWFAHVRTLKVLQYKPESLFNYLQLLIEEKKKGTARLFSKDPLPKQFTLSLIDIFHRYLQQKTMTDIVKIQLIDGTERYLPTREAIFHFYSFIYLNPDIFSQDYMIKEFLFQKLFLACSIPEISIQRAAKSCVLELFQLMEMKYNNQKDAKLPNVVVVGGNKTDFQLITKYWASTTLISMQSIDNNFPYQIDPPPLHSTYVAEAFQNVEPILFLIENMKLSCYHTITSTSLKQDLETYVPVNVMKIGDKKEKKIDLFEEVKDFLKNKQSAAAMGGTGGGAPRRAHHHPHQRKILLIHGNAGSGKTLFCRYLQQSLWNEYQHGRSWIPIFISLSGIKDPIHSAIRETLFTEGFNETSIKLLKFLKLFQKCKLKILFILDGFDEILCKQNLFFTNQLNEWNCKIIITARTEYLLSLGNYQHLFSSSSSSSSSSPSTGQEGSNSGTTTTTMMINEDVNEYFIRPFDSLQRQLFFNKMIQQGFTEWKSSEEFEKNIMMIPGLNHLLTTPFMLRIVTEILPSLVKEQETKNQNNSQKISRALIYQAFMEREFQLNRKLLYQTIPKHQIPINFDEILSFRKFSMNLAIHMFIARVSSVIDKGDDYRYFEEEDYFWDKFFHSSSLTLIASRFGCPLIALGRQRSFRHKSLLEYFTAARLLEILKEFEAIDQSTSSYLAGSDDLKANGLTESIRYFNSRPLHEEPSIVSFLLDMIHLQSNRKMIEEQLWKIIEASKHLSNLAIACGNAISLLVSLHVSFAEKDCSGIHCQDAIFDNGNFMKTNFSHGTFIRSSWDGAILHETNFNEATFQETLIEERACLQPTIANTILDMITIDRYALIAGTNIGGVFIWRQGKLCYFSAKHAECSFAASPNQRWLVCRNEQEISLFDCQAIAMSSSSTSITAQWNCSQIEDDANFFVNDEELIVSRRIENVADDATVKYQLISINLRENDVSIPFLQETILQLPSLSTLIQLIPFDPSSEGNEENKKINYFLCFAIDSLGWRGLSYFERTGINQWKRISFKVVSNLIESMKAIIRIPSSPFFLYQNGRNILELRSIDCLENPFFWNPSLPLSLQENPIDEYVLSPSGQFLLIRIYRTVTVYQVLVESFSSIQFQFLYELNNISSCLAMNQFHSSEQYIAFGCDSVIRVMKSKEMKIVQELSLIDPNVIKEIHFSQELFIADENRSNLSEESGEDILLIRQDGNHELLRRRFDPDELWEEKHPSLTSSSLTSSTSLASLKSSSALMSTSALRINSANAVDNHNDDEDDEDDVAEMSALGATFFNVKGLQVEDQMLMTERGGRFIPEEEMISQYQSTYDAQERLTILIAALRCCYKQFFKTVDWDRNLRLDENLQTTIDQYLILHSRSNSQDYYIEFLTYLISLGLELNHTNERGLTGFILAARKGFLKFMQFYMNQLPSLDINQQAASDGWSALFYAAKNGRKEVCEYLLTLNGIQIELLDVDGTPPLATAAIYGHLNVVRVLLEASANVHHVDTCDGANALHRACQYGFYDIAEIVISYGIDVNVPRSDNFTPLTIAAQNGFYEICELLLTNGASTASVDNKFPLYYAAENGHSKIVQLLLDHQANVFDRLQCGYTAVHGASICGHATILEMLLSHGAEANPAMTVDEYKPIYQAAQNGFVQSCQILIKYGANPSELMPNHYSAFMIATQNGHNDLLRYFLKECGCSLITDRSDRGYQPLYIAADWNYLTMVKLFLEESPEVVNEGKIDELLNIPPTPLSVAVFHGHTPIVEYLISKGAKILTNKNDNGRNVLYVAAAQNNLALVEVILKQLVAQGDEVAPFILETGNDGYNAFFHAVWNGYVELVQLFLNHGVSIHVGNQDGFQAIYLATESNQNKMVEFLLQQGASVLGRVDEDGDNPSVAYKKAKENQNQFLCDLFVQYGAKYD